MAGCAEVNLNGIDLRMHPQGGVDWPSEKTLFVADTHFGKEATFRRHGIPVPVGSTYSTLSVITSLIRATAASRLVILGDMFHARSSLSDDVVTSLDEFFAVHDGLAVTLVRGNHDAHVGQLPEKWPIQVVDPYQRIGNVVLTHHPQPLPATASLLLCGHLHPSVRIGESIGKLRCFYYHAGMLVLPAIGRFTGSHVVNVKVGDRIWAIADDEVISVPTVAPMQAPS
tara:strand:- start:112788 stop:113468 length:681 start_codon:yes stop_codon:yes gene_type:complete